MGRRKNIEDQSLLFGKKINMLLVLDDYRYKKKHLQYLCKCDCGKVKYVDSSHLKRGKTKSCGCLRHKKRKRLPPGVAAKNSAISAYKNSAKKRGLEFSIDRDDMLKLMSDNCHYCGSPPSNIWKGRCKTGNFIYSGIDRKDNDVGYTLENCVSCCKVCNFLKKSMEYDTFLNIIFRIYNTRVLNTEMVSFGELVDKLSTVTIKLFNLCDDKIDMSKHPEKYTADEINSLAEKDVELCKQHAKLKSEIDRLLMGKYAIEEIKSYGGKK